MWSTDYAEGKGGLKHAVWDVILFKLYLNFQFRKKRTSSHNHQPFILNKKVFDITATKMETDSLIFLPDNVLYHSAKKIKIL